MLMQISCGCCTDLRVVTIKGIDKTDGTTVWEYGPGAFWRHHYGADSISGVVPDVEASLNKYAICAGQYPTFAPCGNRNMATLSANVMEALQVVKLSSIDGTTTESATLPGMFCGAVTTEYITLSSGLSITNAAALSGGDYVIVGERLPFIEFVDYSSNTANKEYILHPHGMSGGNVYLKTRTSNETVTIPYNATAGDVETLFEATADCVAATATGGPWPLKPIAIDVEWSVSGGDVASIAATVTQSASGGGSDWSSTTGNYDVGIDYLTLSLTTVSVGTTFKFSLALGLDFTYESETDDVSTFLAALEGAMEAFALAQGADGAWESIASGIPDSVVVAGSSITIYYSTEIGIDPMTVELTAGGDPTSDIRRVGSCAASYDTSTGEMTSAVGYQFGYSAASPPPAIFDETASAPSVTGLNVLGIQGIGSGPTNTVIVKPLSRNNADTAKASVVEVWTIDAGLWTQDWIKYCNAQIRSINTEFVIQCESGYTLCPISAKRFDGVRDRTAAKLRITDGEVTEVMTTYGSVTPPDNNVTTWMYDDDPASYMSFDYDVMYPSSINGRPLARINDHGADTYVNGDELRLAARPFGADGTAVYGVVLGGISGDWRYDYIGNSSEHEAFVKFLTIYNSRAAEPQQFRFKFYKMPGVNYTAWLDWYATESEIETALNDLLGAGNVALIDFGLDPTPVLNDPVALIEYNILLRFYTDAGFTPGSGFIPKHYFDYTNTVMNGGVEIEMQNITPFTSPGIAAYDITNATVLWSRAWGTRGATTVANPAYSWLQGDYVYAYGGIVDNEL